MMKTSSQAAANAFTQIFEKGPLPVETAEFTAEQDEQILMRNLEFAERLFPDNGLGLCPVSHAKKQYFSKNCEHVFGHSHRELLKMGLAEFFTLVHSEDLPLLQQCYRHVKNLMPFDPEMYRFVIQYRIRDSANEYFVIRSENLALKVTETTYLYLILYNRSAEPAEFHRVKLDLLKKKDGLFSQIGAYYPKQEEKRMTPRQADIARLVTKGYSNQEIADQLGISLFTIKNHKKTLFKKVNVKNSVQLANYVKEVSA